MIKNKMKDYFNYVGKNVWKILPGVNEVMLAKEWNKSGNLDLSEGISREEAKNYLKSSGRIILTLAYLFYGSAVCYQGKFNPLEWKSKSSRIETNKLEKSIGEKTFIESK